MQIKADAVDIVQMQNCGTALKSLHHCANQDNPPLSDTQE